jgi:hypothetical protein
MTDLRLKGKLNTHFYFVASINVRIEIREPRVHGVSTMHCKLTENVYFNKRDYSSVVISY